MSFSIRSYEPNRYRWIFLVVILIMCWLYHYHEIMWLHPYSIHQWRQCDCLSMTLNYYHENRSFFEPSVHCVGRSDNGQAISEFPIIYYTVAQLWKLFGQQEWIFRLINTLFLLTGLYSFYKLCEDILKHSVWAIILTAFLFSSPILIFYGNNFLADVPAFSLSLIGWWFFWKHYEYQNQKSFYLSLFLFTFAALLKASAILNLAATGILFISESFFRLRLHSERKVFTRRIQTFILYFLCLTIIVCWYLYAYSYNSKHNKDFFLVGIMPIWELDASSIKDIFTELKNTILPQFFHLPVLITILLSYFFILIKSRKRHPFLTPVSIFITSSVILFMLLFYQVFNVHDYYLINSLMLIAFILLNGILLMKLNFYSIFHSSYFITFFVLITCFCIWYASVNTKVRYFPEEKKENYSMLLSKEKIDFWDWFHFDYKNRYKDLEDIQPYLRSINISRNDRVVCLPDISLNISLYFMDQKGWTNFSLIEKHNDKQIDHGMQHGAKYLIVSDPELLKQDFIQPYIKTKIGEYKKVSVFKLQ